MNVYFSIQISTSPSDQIITTNSYSKYNNWYITFLHNPPWSVNVWVLGIVLSRLYLQLTYEALKHIEEEGPKLPIVRRVKTAEVFKVRWYSDLVLDIDGLEWPRLGEFSSWKYTKNLSIYIILAFFHLLFLFMLHYKYFLNIHHTMSCKIMILYGYFMDAI